MRKVVHKLFWAGDFEEEEKWLNKMAAEGWALASARYVRYEFEKSLPGEYGVCVELLEHTAGHSESRQYLAFLEEMGVECVGTWIRWVYLRKKTADGEFELFSDNKSRVAHLSRILVFLGIIGGMNLYVGLYNIMLLFTVGNEINLLGYVNILLGWTFMCGFGKIKKRKRKLKEEQQIFE